MAIHTEIDHNARQAASYILAGNSHRRQLGIWGTPVFVCLSILLLNAPAAVAQIITTIAGGGAGNNVPAVSAVLNEPNGVAVDASGNVYFTDRNLIRKIAADTGIVSTFAGGGSSGFYSDKLPATSTALRLSSDITPNGLAIGPGGDVFIADWGNNRIRKVSAHTGFIVDVAGTGEQGYNGDGLAATSAKLNLSASYRGPGIAVSASGDLYIADTGNRRIRKVDATTGLISTMAGTGAAGTRVDNIAATVAALDAPQSLAVDRSGNLYFLESNTPYLRKVAAGTGIITTIAGNGLYTGGATGNVKTDNITLGFSRGLALDSAGDIHLADAGGSVRKITLSTGQIATVAGGGYSSNSYNGDNIPATSASLNWPAAVALDAAGNMYIADSRNNRIRKVTQTTGLISTIGGTGEAFGEIGDNVTATRAALYGPTGVAVDSIGNVFIADSLNRRIRKVSAGSGKITTVAGGGAFGTQFVENSDALSMSLTEPTSVAIDLSGNLFIADGRQSRVYKVNAATGQASTVAGGAAEGFSGDNFPAPTAAVYRPFGVAVDVAGNVYIADTSNHRVRKISAATGLISTVAGTGMPGYNGDSIAATSAQLSSPIGVAVDVQGNLYIGDSNNGRLRKVTATTSEISTVVEGLGGARLVATGMRGLSNGPSGVAIDAAGDVYFAAVGRIHKVAAAAGTLTTFAGGGSTDADNVPATSGVLLSPIGVATDQFGNVFIADAGSDVGAQNSRIRKVSIAASEVSGTSYQGLWWNSPAGSESGWGINFAHQGDTIFATWFTYGADGKALWMTMAATKAGAEFNGTIYRTRGPAFSAVPFRPEQVSATAAGSGKLRFSDADNGEFTFTIDGMTHTKSITKQVFGPLPSCFLASQVVLAQATNYQDIWWNSPAGSESGWGVNFTHQGESIFATWFTYNANGSPMWLSASIRKSAPGVYSGTLMRTSGTPFNVVPFVSRNVGFAEVGNLSVRFTDGNAAQFTYTLDGITQSKSIVRQSFSAPASVCVQ